MEYWSVFKNKVFFGVLFMFFCFCGTGCGGMEELSAESFGQKNVTVLGEIDLNIGKEVYVWGTRNCDKEECAGNAVYIDYDHIEQYHKVFKHNISAAPQNDYEDTPLKDYLQNDIERNKEWIMQWGCGSPLAIDYHLFDFNDDGLDDYLVCMHGDGFNGYDGNIVRIYIQESDSSLRMVYDSSEYGENGYIHFHDISIQNEHTPVVVLAEKKNGFFAVVLPGLDYILRYNEERNEYSYYEIESIVPGTEFMESGISKDEYAQKEHRYTEMMAVDKKPYIDYGFIETQHQVLRHNICISPQTDYQDTILKEYIQEEVDKCNDYYKDICQIEVEPLVVDYFQFDFNDDGLDDYLVCFHEIRWTVTQGHSVYIYIQKADGTLEEVLYMQTVIYEPGFGLDGDHAGIAIVDEKSDGYYSFVLPGNNCIVRYDCEKGEYIW